MYLEMLQQRYGAALEKQAMEKQAFNPMQLVQMRRRFAGKGKLDRFNQLLNKRNAAIKTVKGSRAKELGRVGNDVDWERFWRGNINDSLNRQWIRASDRYPTSTGPYNFTKYIRPGRAGRKYFINSLSEPRVAPAISPPRAVRPIQVS